jgi:outer membrane protein OmpA-like peptidoglycan-associated protein
MKKSTKPAGVRSQPSAPGRGHRKSPAAGTPSGLPLFLRKSGGKPLDASVRSSAEAAYGRDLRDVRVHTGSEAAESARALDARAYTTGGDIVFGEGEYATGTAEGQRLLAHELAHVVQQSRGVKPGDSAPSDTHERAAAAAAEHAMRGETASLPSAGPAPAVQRQALPTSTLKPPPFLARAMGSGTIDGFLTGSSTLSGGQKVSLGSIAVNILSLRDSYPGCTVSVTGHTDAVGAETDNLALGQARADAVRDELANHGVPAEIILTDSAGESQLKVDTQAAEPRNRRAEIQFEPEPRFRMMPELTLPPLEQPGNAPPAPVTPIFPPTLPPSLSDPQAETPAETAKRILAPIPPDPRKPRAPLFGPVIDTIDSMMKGMGVPDWARDIVKDGAKAAITKGATSLVDAAMDQTNMTAAEKEAVRKTVEAAVKGELPK